MLIAEPPIYVLPSLAKIFGFNEAAVIQEIHFWLNPNVGPHFSPYFQDGRYWVPDIFEHLYQKFIFWDEDTIAYICASFEQSGILMKLEVENSSTNSGPITYHTLNYEVLREKSGLKPVPASFSIDDILGVSDLDWDPILDDNAANENINMQSYFEAEIHKNAPDVYTMEAQDSFHFLGYELVLEIQDRLEPVESRPPINDPSLVSDVSKKELIKEKEGKVLPNGLPLREVICQFPKIFDAKLKEFIWGDVVLYKIVMTTFQMNVLEQLFLFCEEHEASKMVIFADNDDELKVYHDFLSHKNKSKNIGPTGSRGGEEKGKNAGITIPIDRETLDIWAGFMKTIMSRFRQILRNGQKTNPAIQRYLKLRPLPES